jgi:2-haloacid dehalogenase
MREFDCVVFDIGDVLIRWHPRNLYRRMGYSDATTALILAEVGLIDINHRLLDAGAPYEQTLSDLASRFPHHGEFIEAFHTRWSDMLDGAIAANVDVLHDLQRARIPVYAISNFSREKFEIARSLFPFLDTFDDLVLSGDVGTVKPNPAIFELLIRRRQLDPRRAIYIDDSAPNIATAADLGFATVHFIQGHTDLRAELIRLGVTELAIVQGIKDGTRTGP